MHGKHGYLSRAKSAYLNFKLVFQLFNCWPFDLDASSSKAMACPQQSMVLWKHMISVAHRCALSVFMLSFHLLSSNLDHAGPASSDNTLTIDRVTYTYTILHQLSVKDLGSLTCNLIRKPCAFIASLPTLESSTIWVRFCRVCFGEL